MTYAPAPPGAPPLTDPDELDALACLKSGAWLDAQVFPPLSWAVPGLVPEGFGLFTGPPKAGKSWATLGLALAVASGAPALGKISTGRPRPVLLLALEDGDRRLQGRCRTLLPEGEAIPARLDYATSLRPVEVPAVIASWLGVHGHERPLVVLDTLGKVMPPNAAGENAYQRDYRVGSQLKALVDAFPGSTLLVVHHVNKRSTEGGDWMDSTSGTNGLNGAADFTINLSRARNEDAGLLRVTGRDVPENEYAVTTSGGRWELDGSDLADAARRAADERASNGLGDLSARVISTLGAHPEGIGPTNLLAVVPELKTSSAASVYLNRLADAGRIRKTGRGIYKPLTTPVASVASVSTEGTDQTVATHTTPHLRGLP